MARRLWEALHAALTGRWDHQSISFRGRSRSWSQVADDVLGEMRAVIGRSARDRAVVVGERRGHRQRGRFGDEPRGEHSGDVRFHVERTHLLGDDHGECARDARGSESGVEIPEVLVGGVHLERDPIRAVDGRAWRAAAGQRTRTDVACERDGSAKPRAAAGCLSGAVRPSRARKVTRREHHSSRLAQSCAHQAVLVFRPETGTEALQHPRVRLSKNFYSWASLFRPVCSGRNARTTGR